MRLARRGAWTGVSGGHHWRVGSGGAGKSPKIDELRNPAEYFPTRPGILNLWMDLGMGCSQLPRRERLVDCGNGRIGEGTDGKAGIREAWRVGDVVLFIEKSLAMNVYSEI